MTTYGTISTSSSPDDSGNFRYVSRARNRITSGFGDRRPWREFLGVRSIGLPKSFRDSVRRAKTNIAYFRINYAMVVLLILFLSLLWHPISLIAFVALMAAWLFLYFLRNEPLMIFRRTISDKVVLIVLAVLTIVLLLFTGATFNIVTALIIGVTVVVLHAAIMKTEDEQAGFNSGPGGGASSSSHV